ncbi:flavin reductase family protein [bacterium]|nr:flavin reductase family protein [bacterium]MBU1985304.1 flavin reductase family protein [bacterium]
MKTSLPPFVHSFPAPAVVIGCGTVEKPNLITCSWFGTVCSQPPMVSVAVRGSRYSHRLIHGNWEFTVNLPRVSDLKAVVHCGSVSGRDTNKFDDLGLTAVPCPPLESAPMIAEFGLCLACRVQHELELGTHHVFLAEVVGVHGTERPNDPSRRPEMFPTEQLVYLDGKYWTLRPVE